MVHAVNSFVKVGSGYKAGNWRLKARMEGSELGFTWVSFLHVQRTRFLFHGPLVRSSSGSILPAGGVLDFLGGWTQPSIWGIECSAYVYHSSFMW